MSELEIQLQSQDIVTAIRDDEQCDVCEAEDLCETTEQMSMSQKYA